jgi:hypothetical protein
MDAAHRGVRINLQPRELHAGGWTADFTLNEDNGSIINSTPYYGKNIYPTREEARLVGLHSACRVIDGKLS